MNEMPDQSQAHISLQKIQKLWSESDEVTHAFLTHPFTIRNIIPFIQYVLFEDLDVLLNRPDGTIKSNENDQTYHIKPR